MAVRPPCSSLHINFATCAPADRWSRATELHRGKYAASGGLVAFTQGQHGPVQFGTTVQCPARRGAGRLPRPRHKCVAPGPPGASPLCDQLTPSSRSSGHEAVGAAGQGAAALRQAVALQQRLAQTALDGRGLDGIAAAICGRGGRRGTAPRADGPPARPPRSGRRCSPMTSPPTSGVTLPLAPRSIRASSSIRRCLAAAYARPIPAARGAGAEAWIVVTTADGRVDELIRLVLQQAVAIVGLELTPPRRRRGDRAAADRGPGRRRLRRAHRPRGPGPVAGAPSGCEGEVAVIVFGGAASVGEAVASPGAERALRRLLSRGRSRRRRRRSMRPKGVSFSARSSRSASATRSALPLRSDAGSSRRSRCPREFHAGQPGSRERSAPRCSRARPAAELPRAFQRGLLGARGGRAPARRRRRERAPAADAPTPVGSWQ